MISSKGVGSCIDGVWMWFIEKPSREILRKRRRRIICTKLFCNVLYCFSCVYSSSIVDRVRPRGDESGDLYRVYLWTYIGICAGLPLFSFIGLFMERILVSHTWFEVAWLLGVSGFDVFLITEQDKYRRWIAEVRFQADGFSAVGFNEAMFVLTFASLAIDSGVSLFWSGSLLKSAWTNRGSYQGIWISHAGDILWLADNSQRTPYHFPSLARLVLGTLRHPPAYKTIPVALKRWILGSTMFRRSATFEPRSHRLLRGGVTLLLWAIIIVYGINACTITPFSQFYAEGGLPLKIMAGDYSTSKFGPIYGVIEGEKEVDETIKCNSTAIELQVSSTSTAEGSQCNLYRECWVDLVYGWNRSHAQIPQSLSRRQDSHSAGSDTERRSPDHYRISGGPQNTHRRPFNTSGPPSYVLQVQVWWDCGSVWDGSRFQIPASIPDQRPSISVVWNSQSLYSPFSRLQLYGPLITPNGSIFDWAFNRGDYAIFSSSLELTPGQSGRVDVGRRRVYANRATLLDLIGIPQRPNTIINYPILSFSPNGTPTNSSPTTIDFHAGFGAYNDELVAEYLDHTFLWGLSATGGLYTAFDVLFTLVCGRSLLSALFGGKNISPFGALASVLQARSFRKNLGTEYPGIERKDPQATCNLLHDFILDLTPLEIEPKDMRELPHEQNDAADRPDYTRCRDASPGRE